MESKVQKAKNNADIAEENDGVTAEKIKFPLYVFPETMKTVDILYKSDNCSSRTEFMEKAIRFYCGYLLQNKPELVDYLAPQLATLTEGIVKGTEQRLSRALFKVAVELGAVSHMLAAINDIDDELCVKGVVSETSDEYIVIDVNEDDDLYKDSVLCVQMRSRELTVSLILKRR